MWNRGPAFDPPEVPLDGDRRWILRMAFGPEDSFREGRPSDRRPSETAPGAHLAGEIETLGLGCRIGSRFPKEHLSEIFGEASRTLVRARREAAIRETLAEETLERIAERVRPAEIAIVALKGVALLAGGWIEPGGRGLGDVDLLVREEEAPLVSTALEEIGYEPLAKAEGAYHHHLPPLMHPTLSPVELHTRVPGVRVGGEPASATRMIDGGLTRGSSLGAPVLLPVPPLLAAHAVAHTLYQERYLPNLPGFFRTIGDLLDLAGGEVPRSLVDAASPYLTSSLTPLELEGVRKLAAALSRGEIPEEGSAGRRLLDHELALAEDPEYRRTFRGRRALHALKMGGPGKLVRRILWAIRGR
ncbi:MAG: nucleotidyltransferase family protein [Thermoanaerobaculia bacterium]|nr:nucleotidyltransferase family protein [Thermoanaerobaculia bacterium]